MTVIEIGAPRAVITQRQRWSNYFVLIYAVMAVIVGINLRDSAVNATVQYSNIQAGIRAFYPQRWLIDSQGDYVFRVRDLAAPGFKTSIQVAVEPVAATTSSRNIVDTLTLSRAQRFAAYTPLHRESITLSNDRPALAITYSYVATGDNVFLSTLPIVVEGVDIIVIQRGQAIIISFVSDATTFDDNYPIFQRFLDELVF